MRPVTRRFNPSELEKARKVVSRAERKALDEAEELRRRAEDVLRAIAGRSVDAESEVRAQYEARLAGLHRELDDASRRATVAESQLELLRGGGVAAGNEPDSGAVPPLRLIPDGDGERPVDPFVVAVTASAARLHAQAELDSIRARDEAASVLIAAAREAAERLAAAVSAIQADGGLVAAALAQARSDGETASRHCREAEALLDRAAVEAALIRDDAQRSAERTLYEAGRKAGRVVRSSRQEAAVALSRVQLELAGEVEGLLEAIDRARAQMAEQLRERSNGQRSTSSAPGATPSVSHPGAR